MIFKSRFLLLTGLVLLTSCVSSVISPVEANNISSKKTAKINEVSNSRIVAIGDLHGDLEAAKRAFKLAGAINNQEQWIGKNLTVVQTGDQLDRGPDDKSLMDFLLRMEVQSKKAGSDLYILNGNHEIMNVAKDLRYIAPEGFTTFRGLSGVNLNSDDLKVFPEPVRARVAAFKPGGPYAMQLAQRKVILLLNEIVFVHGGLHPEHVQYGINKINQDFQNWSSGKSPSLPALMNKEDSPVWSRVYSDGKADCNLLEKTLKAAKATSLIIGHTIQEQGINSDCSGKVWRIDVGMSKAYGGKTIEVLEINNGKFRVLKENR